MNIRVSAKVLILTTGTFLAWSCKKSFYFLHRNILFLECSEKDQTYISDILALFEYILRIQILKMRVWRRSRSFLERAKFHAVWNIYSHAAHDDVFLSYSPRGISFSSQSVSIRALAKVLILTTGIFPAWSLNNFFSGLKPNILFLEYAKKHQTHISDILTLFKYILKNQN